MAIIRIDERTETGKAFMAMFEVFFKGIEGIEIIETDSETDNNSEFVAMNDSDK